MVANDTDRALVPTFPRNLLHCEVSINEKPYNLMTLQGVWAKDGVETDGQREMGKRIEQYLDGMDNVILSGDFNTNEQSSAIASLGQRLHNIFAGQRVSSFNMQHKNNPGYAGAVVDFVFTSPGMTVREHHTTDADVSDHQSQVVVLDL